MEQRSEDMQNGVDLRAAMDAWGDMVLRLALCRVRAQSDAEDVFQLVFLKLYEHAGAFRDEEHKKAWLLRVTINCCNDLQKSVWSTRRVTLEHVPEPFTPTSTDAPDLDEAIDRLPNKQRVAVHLYYFEGYSTNEIAAITEENTATVRSHLYRARQALRLALGGTDE